ncbi:peptidase domain-containing ABC transporter [Photobacterium sanctipauli]|uniref:peptidase domain-containing ABC transporter n=1 Tax=Photobacterium sanctipauli TaxID=1342794 RepID=UPI001304FB41|nr:peptidase domain-containing ABC transporter [Photobacterium sanctipauli]
MEAYVLIARYHRVYHSVQTLQREHGVKDDTMAPEALALLVNNSGLQAKDCKLNWQTFLRLGSSFPALIQLKNDSYVVAAGVKASEQGELQVLVQDPQADSLELLAIPEKQFRRNWQGRVILVKPVGDPLTIEQPFGFRWLFQQCLKQPLLLNEVLVISLFLHLIAFVVPMFSMVVFDKVIGYQGYSTLQVLFIGGLVALVASAVLAILRNLLILHAVARLDIEIAHLTCRRMLALPLVFFQQVAAGKLAKQVQEASSIREFITGNLLFTLIEVSAVVVLFPVMLLFSPTLSWLVVGFSILIICSLLVVLRPYRQQLEALYQAEAERQSLIVETVRGMETIKSLALEPQQQRDWLATTASVVKCQHKVGRWSGYINEISGFWQKAMTLTIIWLGAQLVLSGDMTIGTLIAFNIMAGRIAGPLVQLVGLASKYQQTAISVDMLGRVLNCAPERLRTGGITPVVAGKIQLEDVSFSYQPQQPPVLKELNLTIPAGEKVGIVGPSGSGKSTLTRLLQGFYQPNQGYIRIDGSDLREYDLPYLRSQIGVVLQESFLFRGSVRDNIAKARPDKSLDDVIQAAKLSGADQFVEALPQGYDTQLEENATNLSGGQKQRLNFSRALLDNPKILLLDEATSALDAESEQHILERLNQIAQGRTLLNISHRLSSMPRMDKVLVLDQGRLVDFAPHGVLLKRCQLYRQLWQRQFAGILETAQEVAL